jgi:dynactin-5
MLGGRTVIMADVYMRGDLHRFSSSGDGGAAQPTTAISIGR